MSQPSQADIFAALQAQSSSSRKRPPTQLISDLPEGEDAKASLTNGQGTNVTKIHCFRQGCGCVILAPGVGQWISADSNLIPSEDGSPFPGSNASPDNQSAYWHITGSPMSFDNIGFSKPSELKSLSLNAPGNASGKKVKWLSCADCDLGPVGWSFEGGTEAWLAVERVRYGVKP
ncbi:Mss4-like protein [Kockovaella imperatae]|uniref:Mss4-like protein n=1 Tax=Kockovaella imperatae TaxID=4999 RepID=A0A1Y1UC22_9TREE|nr:Mss4-like protein [Kockovaella imperatae]ORX35084.1 Mss4-like protein [Kockovaella imperatae]